MTTGTRTISSTEPSFGLTLKTSTLPNRSAEGGAKVADTVKVPRPGAPADAVVIPCARTRPALSATRHWSAASNTEASPLITNGDDTRAFAEGAAVRDAAVVGGDVRVGAGLGEGELMPSHDTTITESATSSARISGRRPRSPARPPRARAARDRARRRRAGPRSPPSPTRRAARGAPARSR